MAGIDGTDQRDPTSPTLATQAEDLIAALEVARLELSTQRRGLNTHGAQYRELSAKITATDERIGDLRSLALRDLDARLAEDPAYQEAIARLRASTETATAAATAIRRDAERLKKAGSILDEAVRWLAALRDVGA